MKSVIYNLFLCFILASCGSSNSNKDEMSIKGVVRDVSTGEPIQNAKVIALCWKESGFEIDDIDYLKKVVETDQNGRFSFKLERPFLKIDIASNSKAYTPKALRLENYETNNQPIEISLKRFHSKEPAAMNFNEDGIISVRKYSSKKQPEVWGFNLNKGEHTDNKIKADIWIGSSNKHYIPEVILATGKGGIIPIFKKKSWESLLFSYTEAPVEGYLTKYKLTGKEEGLFIKTKDGKTYGKIIFESEIYESIEPTEGGHFKEVGLRFSYIFQKNGSSDLNISPIIDLEEFILKEQ